MDFENLDFVINKLKAYRVKGTTGTQASFMEFFDGDEKKVKALR